MINTVYVKLTTLLKVVITLGAFIIVGTTVVQMMFPCPDFTDGQSGDTGTPHWILIPPGLECTKRGVNPCYRTQAKVSSA